MSKETEKKIKNKKLKAAFFCIFINNASGFIFENEFFKMGRETRVRFFISLKTRTKTRSENNVKHHLCFRFYRGMLESENK